LSESQLPRGYPVATVHQHGRATLAVPRERGQPNERRRKAGQSERSTREGHEVSAGPVKTFRNAGDVKNGTAGLRTKSNLRVKRRDPWHRANVPPTAGADPELNGQDAVDITDVSWPGLPAGGATTSRSELKSLTRNPVAETRWTALLRGRRLRLPWRIASLKVAGQRQR
jgi:hypothetical protein